MSDSIVALVREADGAGFSGSPKELAAALDVDVRRVYDARSKLRRSPKAGTRSAQPEKRRKAFVGAMPPELRAVRKQARSVKCPVCRRSRWCVNVGVAGETFEWGVHVERARLAGCPPLPSVRDLNAGANPLRKR